MNLQEQWALACLTNGYRDTGNLSTPQKVAMMREWGAIHPEDLVAQIGPGGSATLVPAPKKRGRKPK